MIRTEQLEHCLLYTSKMDASRKYRGKIGKVIKNYAKDLEEDLKNAIPDRVFITHSECDAKTCLLYTSRCI